jgi:Zn-dependent peptidase ImmA (M78 family)
MLQRHDNGATVGVNSLHAAVRQRFTIAHEIGHYVLHRRRRFIDEVWVDYRDERASAGTYKQEVEANGFAAELLMPEDLVKRSLGRLIDSGLELSGSDVAASLADEFDVSTEAMSHRLTNLAINLQI